MKRTTSASKSTAKTAGKIAKKTTAKSETSMGPLYLNDKANVQVSRIENGFLVTESGYTGKGKNQEWFNKQYYSAENPIAGIGSKMKFGGKK